MSKLKHVIEAQQFSREFLEKELFPLAGQMARVVEEGGSNGLLSGKRMITFFYEPDCKKK